MKFIEVPNGCLENTNNTNCFKVNRKVMEETNGTLPKNYVRTQIFNGGSSYLGEICHKSVQYIYIKIY